MVLEWYGAGILRSALLFTALLNTLALCSALFHHRSYHASIIFGNYLYIDGGELTTWNGSGSGIMDGYGTQGTYEACNSNASSVLSQCQGNITVLPEPNTYSIDLTSSWTNETVKLEKILKNGPPIVNQEALWQDAGGKAFYAYDGATSNAFDVQNPPSSNTLYQFLPDGAGFGAWSVVPAPANTNFSQLSRAFGAAYTSGNGLGFALGGLQNSQTIAGYPFDAVAQAGLVIYDTSSEQWNNVSALGYSSDGTSTGAAAQFVPNFGPSGLLFVLGGQVNGGRTYVSTASVNIFDPVSRQWKTQEVTGTPPPSSVQSCVVGAQGDNATHEIFFYGGCYNSVEMGVALATVFVLTLPGFHWQKANPMSDYVRTGHSCNIKNKQMIVVGGTVQTVADSNTVSAESEAQGTYLSSVDPWPQGLGVFDLSDMAWAGSYNASAGPYITPAIVKDYYAANARYPDSLLKDATLRDWFKVPDANASSTPASRPQTASQGSSHTGAIAGGTVGGVVALLTITVIAWLTRRYRRRADAYQSNDFREMQSPQHGPLHRSIHGAAVEMSETSGRGRKYGASEIGGNVFHEMEGGRPELAT